MSHVYNSKQFCSLIHSSIVSFFFVTILPPSVKGCNGHCYVVPMQLSSSRMLVSLGLIEKSGSVCGLDKRRHRSHLLYLITRMIPQSELVPGSSRS